MKRTLIAGICLFVGIALAQIPEDQIRLMMQAASQSTPAASPVEVLLADSMHGDPHAMEIGDESDRFFTGQYGWSTNTVRTITRVEFIVQKLRGTVSNYNYTCKIWTLSGANLDTKVAESTNVPGNDSWVDTVISCGLSVPYTVTPNTLYSFTLDNNAITNYSNCILLRYHSDTNYIPGQLGVWYSNGANGGNWSLETMMRIYGY